MKKGTQDSESGESSSGSPQPQVYEQQVQEIAALRAINEALVTQERIEILKLIVLKAVELTPGEYGSLWLMEAATGDLELQAVHLPPGVAVPNVRRLSARTGSVVWSVVQTGAPHICGNAEAAERRGQFYRIYPLAQSSTTVPLRYRGKTTGALNVESRHPNAFSEEHMNLLSSFADLAAVAVESSRSHDQLARKIQELEALTALSPVASNRSLDEILALVYKQLEQVTELTNAEVQFALYDATKDEVSFPLAVEQKDGQIIDVIRWGKREAQYRGPNETEVVEQFRPRARREPPGLTEYVIRSKEPVMIVEDFEQKAAELGSRVWPTFGRQDRAIDSWLGVPMVADGQVTGVISVQSMAQEHPLDQEHNQVIMALANQAVAAIQAERLRRKGHTLVDLLLDIEKRVLEARCPDEILQMAVASAVQVTEATSGVLYLFGDDRQSISRSFHYPPGFKHPKPRMNDKHGLTQRILATGRVLFIRDTREDSHLNPALHGEAQSVIGIPLKIARRLVGVLYVYHRTAERFIDADVSLLLNVVNQIEPALARTN